MEAMKKKEYECSVCKLEMMIEGKRKKRREGKLLGNFKGMLGVLGGKGGRVVVVEI